MIEGTFLKKRGFGVSGQMSGLEFSQHRATAPGACAPAESSNSSTVRYIRERIG